MLPTRYPEEGSDVLQIILEHFPRQRRRVVSRSLSRRHYRDSEALAAEEILSKPVTDEELEEYCLTQQPMRLVIEASSYYTNNNVPTVSDDYYVFKIEGEDLIGYWEFGIDKSNNTTILEGAGSAFEGDTIHDIVSSAIDTFAGYHYGKMFSQTDDYEPVATVTPDIRALKHIHERRLRNFGIDEKYARTILKTHDSVDRQALYLIAQCIAMGLLDPKTYFALGIPKLDEELVEELEGMLFKVI